MSGEGPSGGNGRPGSWTLSLVFLKLTLASLELWVGVGVLEVLGTQAYPFFQPCAHPASTTPPSLSTGSFSKATRPGGCLSVPDTRRLDGPLLPEPGPSAGGCPQDPREEAYALPCPALPCRVLSSFNLQVLELSGEQASGPRRPCHWGHPARPRILRIGGG